MRRIIFVVIIAATMLAALGWADNNTPKHRMGLLYEDPRTIPWIVQDTGDASRPHPRQYVDHSPNMPPVGNQGYQGSCVAFAFAYYYKTYQEWLERGWPLSDTRHRISPAFMYNHINGGIDGGAYASDAMQLLKDMGCATWYDFPYNQANFTFWPSESVYAHALAYRCKQGYSIYINGDPALLTLKQHLESGDNAVLGIWCYANFDNIGSYHNTYCVADVYGSNLGGHGVCVVGYDDTMTTHDGVGALKIVNSWGTAWGASGYFWMSYEAVKSAVTSQQFAWYLRDLSHYTPKLTARFQATHTKRAWVSAQVKYYPNWVKGFFNWTMTPQAGRAFPANKIVLDLTDLLSYLNPYDTTTAELSLRDQLADGVTGTIDYFSTTNYEWGTFSRSSNAPQTIPDTGSAWISCPMPEQKLHWQGFHRLPSHTGATTLTGDMDSVYLYWTHPLSLPTQSSPVLGDVDSDGRLEVLISGSSSLLALNAENGSLCWSAPLNIVNLTPGIGDVDEDGRQEVVVGGSDSSHCLYALNGEDGSQQWSYPIPSENVMTAPCLEDIDDDGRLEAVFGASGSLRAVNGDGGQLWSYAPMAYHFFSTPCCGDVNGDGRFEVVAGADDGRVYCLRGKYGDTLWTFMTGGPVRSSPCYGDIENDTLPEILIGSEDGKLYALNGENGSILWQFQADSGIASSPALADIDQDLRPEVVFGTWRGTVYAINGENGSSRWSVTLPAAIQSSAALARADADTRYEVIVGADNGLVYCLNGEDGTYRWGYNTGSPVGSSPAIGDIETDGKIEVVIGSNAVYALNGTNNGVAGSGPAVPEAVRLRFHPNPAQSRIVFTYSLAQASPVNLTIFDAAGRQVAVLARGEQETGDHRVVWDTRSPPRTELPSGVYFYRFDAGRSVQTGKMVLCR